MLKVYEFVMDRDDAVLTPDTDGEHTQEMDFPEFLTWWGLKTAIDNAKHDEVGCDCVVRLGITNDFAIRYVEHGGDHPDGEVHFQCHAYRHYDSVKQMNEEEE